jgi:5-methyltetrahydropteroyltriglutamate--homocysteine methyltransferase
MPRSTERILVSHAGVLPRPEGLQRLFDAGPRERGAFDAAYSIEAANPRHEHEWVVWQDVKLPDGATLMPGVVGHSTDIIEHPELVAQRLTRYARLVGAENVIAGTDCGLAGRVGHPEIVWAKLEDLAAGASLASRELISG